MASDSLGQIGKFIKHNNRQSEFAIKRVTNRVPKRERARDTVSSLFPFSMVVVSEGDGSKVKLDINFNKPPPSDCTSECVSTTCESHQLYQGSYTLTTENPYESGTVKVFSQGVPLDTSQWYEAGGGLVFVQIQSQVELIIICYSYIIC